MAVSVVVDASVALKWYLNDEADRAPALAIFQAWADGQLDLLAPSFWHYEVANGLRRAAMQRHRELQAEEGRQHLAAFLAMQVPAIDVLPELDAIYEASIRLATTIYDMSYVWVAERSGIEFVTADNRFHNAVCQAKPFVKLLRDYQPPTPGAPETE